MHKRSAPHRVVCKALLVCDEDDKRQNKTAKSLRQARDTHKSIIETNSTTSLQNINGHDAESHASDKRATPRLEDKTSDPMDRQMLLHQATSNLNNLREDSFKAVSTGVKPDVPSHDADTKPTSSVRHLSVSSKLDGKDRKIQPNEKLYSPPKQVSSIDLLPPTKPLVKKYDKKETREYIRKKKLERQEKEKQELEQQKMELESRRQKLMELRDTTLKVLKASIKKKSQTKTEERERNWRDLDDSDYLDAPPFSLNTYAGMRNLNGHSKHDFGFTQSMHYGNYPSKKNELHIEESLKALHLTRESNEGVPMKHHLSHSSGGKIIPQSRSNEVVRGSSNLPHNLANTNVSQTQIHLQSIGEGDDKKEFIRRLSEEVNRLSSSIKFLKENASKTLLETNNINSKSVDGFRYANHSNKKMEISKSCQSIPHEMVSAVTELKDTLTLLSHTNLKPGSNNMHQVPVSMPSTHLTPTERTQTVSKGNVSSSNPNQVAVDSKREEKLQSVYQRHPKRLKHQVPKSDEDQQGASNEESDRSASSGFMFESKSASVKDTDSEELSAQWLKKLALKPNPMNFITTLRSKLNLSNQKDGVLSSDSKQLMMEKMFDAFNKKFKENLEKSLSSDNDTKIPESTHTKITFEPLDQSDLQLKIPTKLDNSEKKRQTEPLPLKNGHLETEGGIQAQEPTGNFSIKRPRTLRAKDKRHKSSKGLGPAIIEPSNSSQKPDCVFLPLSIAHFPSADELKHSGNSSTRSSSTQPVSNMDKPLTVPKLHLKSGLASSSDLSTFHSKSNSEVSTQSKDTLPACHVKMPIRLRQVTAADKSSLSSMSDLSESTVAIENKENESPQADKDIRKIFNPSVLRLQAEAELNQIDLYNESLQQLVDAEHYRDLTLAKEVSGELTAKKDSRSSSHSKHRKKSRSASTTPSLTEITDTSTIMSELLLLPTTELNRSSFNFKFSPDQAINKQSMQMLEQLLKDEEFWANHQKESLKLREKALLNSIRVGIVWFEVQKKQLKDSGQDHLIKNLKKKQRGLLLKLQQEKEEIARLQKTISSASEERRQILLQQYQLVKSQISAKDVLKKKKTNSVPSNNVNSSKYFLTKPVEPSIYKSNSADIVCDKNLGQTLLEGLRALEQEKCKISEREKQLIEHSKNVDELLQWKKKFKDLEKQAGSSRPLRDRSTSPFRMTPEPTNGINPPTIIDTDVCQSKKSQDDAQSNQCGDLHNILLGSKGNLETSGVRSSDHYGSESVESPESSETPRGHQSLCNTDATNAMKNISAHTKQTSIHIKTPLSPRLQNSRRLRYSSGSDDSMIFSQNETLSEQSETEVRVSALHEQLKQRKLEAERLQREHKRAQRERLKMKEQALIKQIQAYDEYIQKTRRELEQELSQAITPVVRPQIKQPRVAEKTVFKRQDSAPPSNLSETSDTVPRKACSGEGQKILDKFFEQGESHSSEIPESDQTENFGREEKDDRLEEVDFSNQAQDKEHENESDVTIKFDELEGDQTLIVHDISNLDQRSERDEISNEKVVLKIDEPAVSEVLPSPLSQLKSNEASSNQNSEVGLSEKLKPCPVQFSHVVSEISVPEVIENSSINKVESEVGSEMPDSVSEMPSLPTAQESDRISVKLISDSIDRSDQRDLIRDQAEQDTQASVKSIVESGDKKSTVSNISSHSVSLKEPSEVLSQEEISPEKTEEAANISSQKFNDNNSDVGKSEKSVSEVCFDSKEPKTVENSAEENVPTRNSMFKPDLEISSSIIIAGEDWMNADDFFEANFPTTNKALKSSENSLQSLLPIDQGKVNMSSSSISGGGLGTKLDFPDQVPDLEIPYSEGPEKMLSSHESESDNEDASSKCDSVASKVSESSVKFSESGKSYEKDRSLSEVIENCEVSEILDTSSASNESCKTFEHDFEETKDTNHLFSNLPETKEEECKQQSLVSPCPSDVTDLITDAILSNLLQDSFECIPPVKPAVGPAEEPVNTMETPFIEALKRDHEALKVKAKGRSDEEKWEVAAERDKLYSAISVAEMLLGVCLNDATETVLNIRKKVEISGQGDSAVDSSINAQECLLEAKKDLLPASIVEPVPKAVEITSVKDQTGVGLGDDVDFNQDWLIDEACVVREAEKLRLKQLQIEQEIERLQQAQQEAQQQTQQAPYIYERYLREIPNKPPPPYTPPVQPESVPTDETIVLNIVTSAAAHIYDSRLIHVEPKPPPSFTSDKNNSLAIYKKFLYDLCLQLINEIYTDDQNESAEPWEKTVKRRAKTKVPTNKAMLIEEIKQKVSILFGFRKKVAKENLIIRWSRKKRDHVDELLVREAQEEEHEWTNYEYDEITVKNQVTVALLNNLLNNTAAALSKAFKTKLEKLEQQENSQSVN